MSLHRVFGPRPVALFGILVLAGAGCRTYMKVPSFHIDASVPGACQDKVAGNHTIPVDDMGGVSVGDTCVAISRNKKDHVSWVPTTTGNRVSIVFLLSRGQRVPFEQMACGPEDQRGTKLCVLLACPEDCKTTFRADYTPAVPEYYYYSPTVSNAPARGEKTGSDAGIRIDP
jgi:hypothetical protein